MKNIKCDDNTGVCKFDDSVEDINAQDKSIAVEKNSDKLNVYYITDPACSFCWEAEAQINRFKSEYKDMMNFETIMGGLVKKWEISENLESEKKMQKHWQELSKVYRMPTSGEMWTQDTLTSSYIPSQVFCVLKAINHNLADYFMRRVREAMYIDNRNPANTELLKTLVEKSVCQYNCKYEKNIELDVDKTVDFALSDEGYQILRQDFAKRSSFGIKSFPSLVIVGNDGNSMLVAGKNEYESYDYAFKEMYKKSLKVKEPTDISKIDIEGDMMFSIELEEMYSLRKDDIKTFLKNIDTNIYNIKEILGELTIVRK